MHVRMLVGARAGEIQDMAFEAARHLLETGQAEDPYAERLAPEVRSDRIEQTNVFSAPMDSMSPGIESHGFESSADVAKPATSAQPVSKKHGRQKA